MSIERQPEKIVVHCTGRIVIESWGDFAYAVRNLIPEGKPIRVDLAQVTFVDSTGLGTFVTVWAAAKRRGCDLKFIHPNERILDLVHVTALHGLLIEDARGAAAPS